MWVGGWRRFTKRAAFADYGDSAKKDGTLHLAIYRWMAYNVTTSIIDRLHRFQLKLILLLGNGTRWYKWHSDEDGFICT